MIANRSLIVTSKINPAVQEKITAAGWNVLLHGGTALDAVIRATNVSELDPRDTTVGYGGNLNEEGFLQLDASVMSGADNNSAGAVAALESIKTPSSVARLVMEQLDHVLLVGQGALEFAKAHGFKEENLVTEEAHQRWLDWKRRSNKPSYYRSQSKGHELKDGGTINVLALASRGDIAGVSSTIGLPFKLVGRVGDSAVIGAGLYVDNDIGAAGATGYGEESIKVCSSFLAVEKMREGMSPQEACSYVCQRMVDRHNGHPMFNVKLVALNKDGEHGCCNIRARHEPGTNCYCVHDHDGHRVLNCKTLLPALTEEQLESLPLGRFH